jgi:hypothetical protein
MNDKIPRGFPNKQEGCKCQGLTGSMSFKVPHVEEGW